MAMLKYAHEKRIGDCAIYRLAASNIVNGATVILDTHYLLHLWLDVHSTFTLDIKFQDMKNIILLCYGVYFLCSIFFDLPTNIYSYNL